jgi:hypothetical protein
MDGLLRRRGAGGPILIGIEEEANRRAFRLLGKAVGGPSMSVHENAEGVNEEEKVVGVVVVFVTPGAAAFLEEGLVDQRERCGHAS